MRNKMSELEERYNFKQTEPKWQKEWQEKIGGMMIGKLNYWHL